jgi:NAD(P)-dependent dehydrogenase (short-subunit alcohol dehydrogenase family)
VYPTALQVHPLYHSNNGSSPVYSHRGGAGSLTARGDKIITKTPFGRFGDAKELVGPLIMLCSSSSSFITGTVVNVDGGFGCFSGV